MPQRYVADWRPNPPRRALSCDMQRWLTDPGSLTARLQARGQFSVRLLNQSLDCPTADEAPVLGLAPDKLAYVREVALHCHGKPVVFAHTVLPRQPRGPLCRWLARLGERSLGALLFAHHGFARGPLTCCRLAPKHPLFKRAALTLQLDPLPRELWARRSCFTFNNQRVLVTEIFHPLLGTAVTEHQG